jgi:hypothetical protein
MFFVIQSDHIGNVNKDTWYRMPERETISLLCFIFGGASGGFYSAWESSRKRGH